MELWIALACTMAAVVGVDCLGARAAGQNYQQVRGIVRAGAATTLSSEIAARVLELPLKAGRAFRKGDLLLSFDCRRYEADLRAAEAEVKTQEITVETSRLLLNRRAAGANDVALADAKLAQATAAAESLRVRASQCMIVAPYDGRVVERIVDIFETPQPNIPLMKIVKDGDLEVDIIVPSSWAVWLKGGDEFLFRVDETQTEQRVRLIELGAVVDPISRTLKSWGRIIGNAPGVLPGMSGTAELRGPAGAIERDGR